MNKSLVRVFLVAVVSLIFVSCGSSTSNEEMVAIPTVAEETPITAQVPTPVVEPPTQTSAPPTLTPVPPTATPEPIQDDVFVDVTEKLEYQKAELPSIFIPPNALSESTTLNIKQVEAPVSPVDLQPIGPAFDITLATGNLRESIEIALPIDTPVQDHSSAFVACFDENEGWIALPSWYSEEDQMLHASTSHFSLFRSFLSILPIRPKITYKQAVPNPLQGVGWPPCFSDPLVIRVEAHDPNGDIEGVRVQLRIHNFSTVAIINLDQFGQAMFGLGLVMTAGGPAAALPAAQTALTLGGTKDPGIVASDWVEIVGSPDYPGVYVSTIDLSPLSTCEGGTFDVDRIMLGTGIERIEIVIHVKDNSGQVSEEIIEIPVFTAELPYAELESPGPSIADVQPPRPVFTWVIEHAVFSDYEQTLVYARGDRLWERWFGKEAISLEWNEDSWQPPQDLKPGEYVWGIEIESEDSTTRSTVYHFTIPEYWVELSVDGQTVNRTELDAPSSSVGLAWVVSRNHEIILERVADNETILDLQQIHGDRLEDGLYVVWIKGRYSNDYHKISNEVELLIISQPLSVDVHYGPASNNWIPGDLREYSQASVDEIIFGECANLEWDIQGGGATVVLLNGETVALSGNQEFCVARNTEYTLEIFADVSLIETAQGTIEIKPARPGVVAGYRFSDSTIIQKGGAYCTDFGIMEKLGDNDQSFDGHPMAYLVTSFQDGFHYYFFTEEALISCR